MKARTRVAAAVLAFAALPLIVVTGLSLAERQKDAARVADQRLSGNAEEIASLLASSRTRWLESVRADAGLPGVDEMLVAGDAADAVRTGRFFAAVRSRDTVNISAVGLIDLDGRVVHDSQAVNIGRDESLEPWFLRTLAAGQPQLVGPVAPAGTVDRSALFVTALVRDARDERVGVLRVQLESALLGQVIGASMVATPDLSATLLDEAGHPLVGIGAGRDDVASVPVDAGRDAVDLRNAGGERIAVAPVPGAPWRLAVRQDEARWAAPQTELQQAWLTQTALLLGLLLAASALLGRRIAAPLARFGDVARRMAAGDFRPVPRWRGTEEARDLGDALDGLAGRLRDTIGSLSAELAQRREAEAALQASRAEYLALVEHLPGAVYRCSNRPGWPMDYLSPQVEPLCGFAPDALLAGDAQGFTALIDPEDQVRNAEAVDAALAGDGRFELRYRIRHRDGSQRWIWELGAVHRAADGSQGHLTGVLFDITERETARQAMALLRGGIDTRVGGDFFVALASGLARALGMDTVLIGRFEGHPATHVRSLALAHRDGRHEAVHFAVDGTPTAWVLAEGALDVPDALVHRFPDDADLARRGLRAYVGRRLDDRHGQPIGILAMFCAEPLAPDATPARMLDLFQPRVAAELERLLADERLQRLADTLEQRVAERTAELETANAALSQAMAQLVQREKLASLGSLVAGVAHELNTPIGNALTVATALADIHHQFGDDLAAGTLKRSALDRFVAENTEATHLIERNLKRAADLISQFKQVAVDQVSVRRRRFDVAELVRDVLATLNMTLRRLPHTVQVDVPDGLSLDSYPGPLEQVLTNLIENSLVHAFGPDQAGTIRLRARAIDDRVELRFEDDGRGIPPDLRHRVFDPFFTTRLGQGGSGLGLYLVYNLLHGRLGGSIRLADGDGPGTCFIIDLPATAPATLDGTHE